MPTATKTKPRPTDPLDQLEALEAKVEEHRSKASAYRRQHYEAQQRFRELTEQRQRAFRDRPDEFKVDGSPQDRTAAAEIDAELGKIGKLDFTAEFTRAEHSQRIAEQERAAYRFEHAEEIATALAEAGEAVTSAFVDWLGEGLEKARAVEGVVQQLNALTGALPGAISAQDVKSDQAVRDVALTIESLMERHEFIAPYSRSLTPRFPGEGQFVIGPSGDGYINAVNAR